MRETAQPTQLCANCGGASMTPFYTLKDVPTNSVLLFDSPEAAKAIAKGNIVLGYCDQCSFVSNLAFAPELTEYSGRYESTQAYSATFSRFHRRLAADLIARFELNEKRIIEIGCGTGDFLIMLCEMGRNQGLGYDPAYIAGRHQIPAGLNIDFVPAYYDEASAQAAVDFICCKMTLEHIADTAGFLQMLSRSVAKSENRLIFFQVPNAHYVFGEVAFWDIYYEHCSYFGRESLRYLFESVGFGVSDCWTDYADQYLMIAAHNQPLTERPTKLEPHNAMRAAVRGFQRQIPDSLALWRSRFNHWQAANKRTVIWGGGSKAVAFISTLNLSDEIAYIVDINPHKEGTFLPGSGHAVVNPDYLRGRLPDVVVIMNPVYKDEIGETLADLGCYPDLITV